MYFLGINVEGFRIQNKGKADFTMKFFWDPRSIYKK